MLEVSGSSQADSFNGFGNKSIFSDELEEVYVHLEFELSSLVIPLW